MVQNQIRSLREYAQSWSEDLELLRQNWLLTESSFITFARERGVRVHGLITGDLSDFHNQGWFPSDDTDYDSGLRFHPFRLYSLHKLLERVALAKPLASNGRQLTDLPDVQQITEAASQANNIADLAILLEPVYWPDIVSSLSMRAGYTDKQFEALRGAYREKVLALVRTLDSSFWKNAHESMRIDAGGMDDNHELYLFLRLARWDKRKELKGPLSGALWIRHIAEVIRRGFEEVHSESWLEEDRAFGMWSAGARQRAYGAERPLDDPLRCKPYLAFNYGLFTGSIVRWYVEGHTEYYAILELLTEPAKFGVELINLRGNIESGRDNAALKLEDWLKEDKALRRFSLISFDYDVPENVKAIGRQATAGNVVGTIAAHKPDFEFANFSIRELIEVAAQIDEVHGFSGNAIRNGDWAGVCNGRCFQKRYTVLSARKPASLKGEEWGRALAAYAADHPRRPDNGTERRLLQDIRAAFHARIWSYDLSKERVKFDPTTFELIPYGRHGAN